MERPVFVRVVAREDRREKRGGVARFFGQAGEGHHVARQRAAGKRRTGADVSFLADARFGAQAALDLAGVRADGLA